MSQTEPKDGDVVAFVEVERGHGVELWLTDGEEEAEIARTAVPGRYELVRVSDGSFREESKVRE